MGLILSEITYCDSKSLLRIRSFCRFKPPLQQAAAESAASGGRCRLRPEPLYYYDVGAARCLPFRGGSCTRSRNVFVSEESCLRSCVVEGLWAAEEAEN